MNNPKVYVAGHKGMVGSALVRLLKRKKVEIITKESALYSNATLLVNKVLSIIIHRL